MDNLDLQHILVGIQSMDFHSSLSCIRKPEFRFVLCIRCLVHIALNHNRLVHLELVQSAVSNVQMDCHTGLLGTNKLDCDLQLYTMHIDRKFQHMDLNNVDSNKLC